MSAKDITQIEEKILKNLSAEVDLGKMSRTVTSSFMMNPNASRLPQDNTNTESFLSANPVGIQLNVNRASPQSVSLM